MLEDLEDLADLTPVYPEEWTLLILQEYNSLLQDGIIQLKNQCRVLHPTIGMTLCVRRLHHTGSHGTLEYRAGLDTRYALLWEPSLGEKRFVGRKRIY